MSEAFDKCVRNGGRVRRISGPDKHHGLDETEYVNYCWRNGESFRGEVHKKKPEGGKEE